MTGSDIRRIRVDVLGETQTQFAERLGYANYQRVQELEARKETDIPERSAWRVRALKLDKLTT